MTLTRFAACAAFFIVPALASAQTTKPAEKSPEAKQAEEAVRAQAGKFYGLLVAGKPRAAEALVCEASKDQFYAMKKGSPRSFDVRSATLSDDLKSAKVITAVEDEYPLGFEKKLIKMPLPSEWKLEADQWCYYLPPDTGEIDTPFGKMNLKNDGKGNPAGILPASAQPAVNPDSLSRMVSFSKEELALPFDADGKDEIVVTQRSPWADPVPTIVFVRSWIGVQDGPGLRCRGQIGQAACGVRVQRYANQRTRGGSPLGSAVRHDDQVSD